MIVWAQYIHFMILLPYMFIIIEVWFVSWWYFSLNHQPSKSPSSCDLRIEYIYGIRPSDTMTFIFHQSNYFLVISDPEWVFFVIIISDPEYVFFGIIREIKGPTATLYCDVPTEKVIFKGE